MLGRSYYKIRAIYFLMFLFLGFIALYLPTNVPFTLDQWMTNGKTIGLSVYFVMLSSLICLIAWVINAKILKQKGEVDVSQQVLDEDEMQYQNRLKLESRINDISLTTVIALLIVFMSMTNILVSTHMLVLFTLFGGAAYYLISSIIIYYMSRHE